MSFSQRLAINKALYRHKGVTSSLLALLFLTDDTHRRGNKQQRWSGGLGVSNCSCDSTSWQEQQQQQQQPFQRLSNKFSRLARHRTIRKMEKLSTRATLNSRYAVQWDRPLGSGAFGEVFQAIDRRTGEIVACKKIDKKLTNNRDFQREMDALLHLKKLGGHPNICSLHEHFDEGDYYYLILDLISGGEMFDHLCNLGPYSEADAARLTREVASALSFMHGIGIVHGDLKPENLMLSSEKSSDAVIKVVDFGCAEVTSDDSTFDAESAVIGNTPAYCPPEVLGQRNTNSMNPSFDMWSLGIILYIMLTGLHPFDLNGQSSDEEITTRIVSKEEIPLRDSPITAHLSESAIDLIEQLINWDEVNRMTAFEMLSHPWVKGITASEEKMTGSDKRLSTYRRFKSGLEANVFKKIYDWSNENQRRKSGQRYGTNTDNVSTKTSLIERCFKDFDPEQKGYVTTKDLQQSLSVGDKQPRENNDDKDDQLSYTAFSELLSENMRNKYFPSGHYIYREGDVGNHMYFINSGSIQTHTKDGGEPIEKSQGDFFGEGALLRDSKLRYSSAKCTTPVHVIEISREYFEKYLASSVDLKIDMREKDKEKRRSRAKAILRAQSRMKPMTFKNGQHLFKSLEEGDHLFILEKGEVDVLVEGHTVLHLEEPGSLCGENSVITGRPRNASTVCTSATCDVHLMAGNDFRSLLDHNSNLKDALKDEVARREFQKALVFKTKKSFPTDEADLMDAFCAADEDASGYISLENVRNMLKSYDPNVKTQDVLEILNSLDLDQSGAVTFDEFKRIFRMNDQD